MDICYNFFMDNAQLIYFIVVGTLIAFCVVSFVLIAACGSGKGVKIFFCVFDVVILLLSILFALIWKGIIFDALAPVMSAIKRAKVAPYLAMALVMVYTSELTGLILSIGKGKKAVEDVPMPAQKTTEYVLPDNRRKADERKHGDYKISEDK